MVNRLRIARLDPQPYQALAGGSPDAALKRRLDALIGQHLPGVTASLLAEPQPTADGRFVEWYSDLSGQPIPLASLPPDARAAAAALLADRLQSLAALADRLAAREGESERVNDLRQALSYPGEATVYVVDGQPVLTFWGHRSAAAAAPATGGMAAPPLPPADDAGPAAGRRRRRWLAPGLGVLVLALIAVGLLASGLVRWPPWGPDYAALLQAANDEDQALRQRLARLTADLEARLAYCALQASLAAAQAEEQRLADRLAEAVGTLAADHALCPLRTALAAAVQEGAALDRKRSQVARDLARAIDDCRKKALAEARTAEAARRQAEAEKRQAEAEKRRAAEAERQAEQARRPAEDAAPAPRQSAVVPPSPPDRPPGPQAGQPEAPPPRTTPPGLPPCPGERTPEEAPDAAIVLDASGSMRLPADASLAEIQKGLSQLGPLGALGAAILGQTAGSGASRLDAAKRGINSVVGSMPADVDVGLVTLQRCPSATNDGFFSGAQRDRLYARVSALTPMQGTPLAEGILQAGQMVDGVKAPAVMVVISDGDDSCGGNPCAAARQLKAAKPLLTINVVDILGNGAGACMATATGGQVLKPGDGLAFEKTIKQAAQDAIKPAHCR